MRFLWEVDLWPAGAGKRLIWLVRKERKLEPVSTGNVVFRSTVDITVLILPEGIVSVGKDAIKSVLMHTSKGTRKRMLLQWRHLKRSTDDDYVSNCHN